MTHLTSCCLKDYLRVKLLQLKEVVNTKDSPGPNCALNKF